MNLLDKIKKPLLTAGLGVVLSTAAMAQESPFSESRYVVIERGNGGAITNVYKVENGKDITFDKDFNLWSIANYDGNEPVQFTHGDIQFIPAKSDKKWDSYCEFRSEHTDLPYERFCGYKDDKGNSYLLEPRRN